MLPYLLLCREDAGQHEHDLRAVFNAVRYMARSGCSERLFVATDPERLTAVGRSVSAVSSPAGRGCVRGAGVGCPIDRTRVGRAQGPTDGNLH